MLSRDNQGEVVGEINNSFTDNGDRLSRTLCIIVAIRCSSTSPFVTTKGKFVQRTSSVGNFCPDPDLRPGFPRGNEGEHMQIGEMLRTIVVEPLELPVKQPTGEHEPELIQPPEHEPERMPVAL
jgi:hypothetical protein